MAIKLLSSTKIGNFSLPTTDGTSGQALVTDGNGNISFAHTGGMSGLSFSNGVLTASTASGNITVNLDGRYALSSHNHSGVYDNYQSWNLKTNGIQRTTVQSGGTLDLVAGSNVTLSYGAGGVVTIAAASSTETDTLATVTGRGASTSTPVTFNGNVTLGNSADLVFQDLAGTFPTSGKGFDWTLNNDGARIYAIQPGSDSIDLVFQLRDNATSNDRFVFWVKEWQGAAFDKYPLIIRGGTEFDLVDAGLFVRGTQVITNARNLQNVTGNISMFTNDSGYITGSGSTSGNAGSATVLQTARTINGTSFNGSANITTASWGTARTITIGSTGKSVDGSGNISWTLAEIGAQAAGSYAAASHTHVWTDITNRPTTVSSFTNDSGYITASASISGNAATATTLQTARTITIGNTGKTFNGSANVSWSLAEIGAQAAGSYAASSHTHSASDITTGTLSTARLSEFIDNKYTYQTNSYGAGAGVYMPMVKGGLYTTSTSTITGRLRIKLPSFKTDMMISFIIDVYEYDSDRFTSYYVSGYNYSDAGATWYNTSAITLADSDNRNLYVRFGSDTSGGYQCVAIGETDTSWTYPQVVVRDVMGGYSTDINDILNTWTIEFVTTDSASYPHSHITNQPIVDWTRIVNAPGTFTPSSHTHDDRYYTESEINNFYSGTTGITGYNKSNWDTAYGWGNHASSGYATQAYVNTAVANVVNSAPAALDTLNELAAALGNDASFSTTVSTALGNRLRVDTAAQGLTGTQQSNARTNLGLGSAATSNTGDFATAGHTHSAATTSAAGFMSAADKTKLDGISSGATANAGTVTSVSGTGSYGGLTLSGTVTSSGSLTLGGTPSGTWPISVSGSAASATTATTATQVYRGIIEDTRAAQRTPDDYDDYRVSWEFTNQITGAADWHTAMTMQGWHNGYAAWQIIGPATTTAYENFYLRSGINGSWNTLRTIIHSGNIGSQSVNYATSAGSASSATTATNVSGTVAIGNGGTGATTAAGARTNLGLGTAATSNTGDFAASGHTHSNATTGAAGFMSAADKSKLDGIASGATANSGTVTSVSGTGSVNGITLSGTVTSSGSLTLGGSVSISIDNITDEPRVFNNMGQNHSTQTDFNSISDFGFRFVQGSTNGPGTGSSQFYGMSLGLGNDYAFSSYAMQLAIPRYNSSDRYISFRTREGGSWGSWYKIYAGYADTANALSSMNISQFTNNSGYITGINSSMVTTALGYTPYNSSNPSGYISGITSAMVTTALGFTPYNSTNPNGYITSSGSISGNAATATYATSAGTADQIDGVGFRNTGSNAGINADTLESNGITYYTGGVTNFSGNASDGALYSQAYSSSWQHQIAGDYRSGMIAVRGKNNGTWTSWRTIIDSSTIGSQSVNYATTAGSAPANGGNSNTVAGLSVHSARNNEANKIVRTDGNGYIQAGWINTPSGAFGSSITKIYCSDDDYVRYQTPANFISNLGLITTSNIGSQSVNYASSAGSVAWGNVSGRPTAVSSFTNDSGYITSGGSISGSSRLLAHVDGPRDLSDRRPNWNARTATFDFVGAGTGNGSGNYAGVLTFVPWDGTSASTGDSSYQLSFANQSGVNASGPARLSIRNGINSTWNSWQEILTSSNYNSYSPTLTGGNASGTWGINITGNAATASSASSVAWSNVSSKPGNLTYWDTWYGSAYLGSDGNLYMGWAGTWLSGWLNQSVRTDGTPTFGQVYNNGWFRNYGRQGLYNQDYGNHWYAHSDSYWTLAGNNGSAVGIMFRSGGHEGTLRGYVYADSSNQIGFLNSGGSWSLRCDNSGNVTATGDLTAYSDARIKTEVKTVEDALDKVLALRGVTYKRTDIEDKSTKIGLIAQEVKEVLPEVVSEKEDGMLTVSYGNMVGVLIEAMKEQQAMIETLEAKIELLTRYLK